MLTFGEAILRLPKNSNIDCAHFMVFLLILNKRLSLYVTRKKKFSNQYLKGKTAILMTIKIIVYFTMLGVCWVANIRVIQQITLINYL